jgi:hypothetical protein
MSDTILVRNCESTWSITPSSPYRIIGNFGVTSVALSGLVHMGRSRANSDPYTAQDSSYERPPRFFQEWLVSTRTFMSTIYDIRVCSGYYSARATVRVIILTLVSTSRVPISFFILPSLVPVAFFNTIYLYQFSSVKLPNLFLT